MEERAGGGVMEEGDGVLSEQWRDVALWHVGIFRLVYLSSSLLSVLESCGDMLGGGAT